MGFEALDLLIALIFGATSNLFFSGTALEIPFALGGPAIILMTLYFGKKGKPENFLIHFIQYHLNAGFYAAGEKANPNSRNRIYE